MFTALVNLFRLFSSIHWPLSVVEIILKCGVWLKNEEKCILINFITITNNIRSIFGVCWKILTWWVNDKIHVVSLILWRFLTHFVKFIILSWCDINRHSFPWFMRMWCSKQSWDQFADIQIYVLFSKRNEVELFNQRALFVLSDNSGKKESKTKKFYISFLNTLQGNNFERRTAILNETMQTSKQTFDSCQDTVKILKIGTP